MSNRRSLNIDYDPDGLSNDSNQSSSSSLTNAKIKWNRHVPRRLPKAGPRKLSEDSHDIEVGNFCSF